MYSMKGARTGQHVVDKVKKFFETFRVDPKKLCCIITYGAQQ